MSTQSERKISTRLLVVEDEEGIAGPIKRGLEEEGYRVDLAFDGNAGLRLALAGDYDIAIVDWRLPGLDGRTLIERLRAAKIKTSVLMLTARRDIDSRVAGLEAGADDYLTKPFAFAELVARLKALLRRVESWDEPASYKMTHLETGPLEMDTTRRTVHVNGNPVDLRSKEFMLLEMLMRLDGRVATRTAIAEHVWGSVFDVTDNAIDITVSTLRQSLGKALVDRPPSIAVETVRGVGYRLVENQLSEPGQSASQ